MVTTVCERCSDISPGQKVRVDCCLRAVFRVDICPGGPNVRLTFVQVNTNVQVDICPGSRIWEAKQVKYLREPP